jgi:hypothetical protein
MYPFKHALLAISLAILSAQAFSRSVQSTIFIKSLSIDPVMPARPQAWLSGVQLIAQTAESSPPTYSKLVIQIKQAGLNVCGNSAATGILVAPFDIKTFSITDVNATLSLCPTLAAGPYTICAQFLNDKNEALSIEVCKEFLVKEAVNVKTYSPPVNTLPADNKFLNTEDIKSPVTFRWTAVSPLPAEQLTYRLRLWPITEGQNVQQVVDNAPPLLTKDVTDATELTLTNVVSCKVGSNCRYIWNVQALNSQGQPVGSNNGYSQPTAIVATTYIIRIDSIKVTCTATAGVYAFSMTIGNANANTASFDVLAITSSTPAGATLISFTPPIGTNIVSGGQLTITGTISASPSLSTICIGAGIKDVTNGFNKAQKDTCVNVAPCKCEACDPKKTNISITPGTNIVVNANNTLTLTQPIIITTTPPKLVKSIKAELMYFEFLPESEDCMPCNKDSKTFGNLGISTLAGVVASGTGTHSLLWIFSPPKNFATANNAVITITLPPTVKCCSATVRWCIRYVVTFTDCTVCSKVVCYEKKKDGCATGSTNPNNN